MAVESKPLFQPEVVRGNLQSFTLPASVEASLPRLKSWADLIVSGRADNMKETALLPEFISEIFIALLGYSGPAGGTDTFTLSREAHVEVDGRIADAVLGRFHSGEPKFIAVLEGKGVRDRRGHPWPHLRAIHHRSRAPQAGFGTRRRD